jgi:hypothetical protein
VEPPSGSDFEKKRAKKEEDKKRAKREKEEARTRREDEAREREKIKNKNKVQRPPFNFEKVRFNDCLPEIRSYGLSRKNHKS